jgi:hypothetical protein
MMLKKGAPMVRRRTHTESRERKENGNGPHTATAVQQRDGPEESAAVRRAEEMVDRMAERLGHYAGILGHKIMWLAARAREEAEDIWAEAQALRHGQKR